MTLESYNALSPRDKDALVAEKVLGCVVLGPQTKGPVTYLSHYCQDGQHWQPFLVKVRHYTTDIAAAWDVVDRMGRCWDFFQQTDGSWRAKLTDTARFKLSRVNGEGRTLPEAICLAALRAKGVVK